MEAGNDQDSRTNLKVKVLDFVQLGGPGGSVMRSLQCTASIQGRPWLIRSYMEERVVLWFSVLEGSRVVGRRPRPERFAYRMAKGVRQDHGEIHLPI